MTTPARTIHRLSVIAAIATLASCSAKQPDSTAVATTPAPAPELLKPIAGIQDIMAEMIDPSADYLWESVQTIVSVRGVEEHQPRTDAEWAEFRRRAIVLTEGANLLLIKGRHVAREGKLLEDHGTPGNLTAAEAEQAIATDRATFDSFAQALRDVGAQMLKAADNKDVAAILENGGTLDEVCESCHLKFWYPDQNYPGQSSPASPPAAGK